MTVEELVSLLGEFDPEAEVRIASAPRDALEYEVRDVDVPDDAPEEVATDAIVYVFAGRCLPPFSYAAVRGSGVA